MTPSNLHDNITLRPTVLSALIVATALLFLIYTSPTSACTAFIAGRNATVKGYTINTHTDDCYDCDFRIVQIPGRTNLLTNNKHDNNKDNNKDNKDLTDSASPSSPPSYQPQRPVQPQSFSYPRFVGDWRGSAFYQEYLDQAIYNWTSTLPMSHIPQINTTFSYIEGSYAISNEYGVALGESTCGGRWIAAPLFAGGKALFEIGELGKIALERSKTAREAIILMGDLAVKHGYYTAEWGPTDQQEGGEAYTITDPFEAWVFHILPTPSGDSAIWAAQRVPDNHAAVVTNSFIIRQVPFQHELDPNTFLYSSNIFDIAIDNNLWDPNKGERLDFKTVYGYPMPIYREPYVSRRQWRVLSTLTPSLNLQPTLTSFELPFSVKPDELITLDQVIALHRDHFEGTAFDTTVGVEAGPFGNPNRWDQYESTDDDSITSILQALYNKDQKDVIIASSIGQEELVVPNFLPHPVLAKLSNDAEIFKLFALSKKLNFTHRDYTAQTQHEYNTIIQNLSESSINQLKAKSTSGPVGDVLNIDRSQGEPMNDATLGKGFFERTISLFRTSYSHITTLSPSFSSQHYPGTHFISQDPIFVPSYLPGSNSELESGPGAHTTAHHSAPFARAPRKEVYKKNRNSIPTTFSAVIPPSQTYTESLIPRTLAFVSYVSLHQPASSTYTPMFPALPTQLNLEWTQGSLWKYSQHSAWWKFSTVANYANNYYRFIIRDINYTQQQHEAMVFAQIEGLMEQYQSCLLTAHNDSTAAQAATDSTMINNGTPTETMTSFDELWVSAEILAVLKQSEDDLLGQMASFYNDTRGTTTYTPFNSIQDNQSLDDIRSDADSKTTATAPSRQYTSSLKQCAALITSQTHSTSFSLSTQVLSTWTDLFHHILGRYHDGYRLDTPGAEVYSATPLFYPTFWLKLVRFWRLSLGDPAAGRGYEYLNGQSTALFAINTTTSRRERYYEVDQDFNPGQQCLSPRLYDGSGDPETIANSYTDRLLLNNGYNLLRSSVNNAMTGRSGENGTPTPPGRNADSPLQPKSPILVSSPDGADGVNIYNFYNNKDRQKKIQEGAPGEGANNSTASAIKHSSEDPKSTSSSPTSPHHHIDSSPSSPPPQQQQYQYQSNLDGITDVIALYVIFTIVAAGLILIGYLIGRSSNKNQLELSKQNVRALQYIIQSNYNHSNPNGMMMGLDGVSIASGVSRPTAPGNHSPFPLQPRSDAQNGYVYDTYQNSNASMSGGNGQQQGGAGNQNSSKKGKHHNPTVSSANSSLHHHHQQQQQQQQPPFDSNTFWNEQQQIYLQKFHGASPFYPQYHPTTDHDTSPNQFNGVNQPPQQTYGSMNQTPFGSGKMRHDGQPQHDHQHDRSQNNQRMSQHTHNTNDNNNNQMGSNNHHNNNNHNQTLLSMHRSQSLSSFHNNNNHHNHNNNNNNGTNTVNIASAVAVETDLTPMRLSPGAEQRSQFQKQQQQQQSRQNPFADLVTMQPNERNFGDSNKDDIGNTRSPRQQRRQNQQAMPPPQEPFFNANNASNNNNDQVDYENGNDEEYQPLLH